MMEKVRVVDEILEQLTITKEKVVLVFNKTDLDTNANTKNSPALPWTCHMSISLLKRKMELKNSHPNCFQK